MKDCREDKMTIRRCKDGDGENCFDVYCIFCNMLIGHVRVSELPSYQLSFCNSKCQMAYKIQQEQ